MIKKKQVNLRCGASVFLSMYGEPYSILGVEFVIHRATCPLSGKIKKRGWQATEPLTGFRATENMQTIDQVKTYLDFKMFSRGTKSARHLIRKTLKSYGRRYD